MATQKQIAYMLKQKARQRFEPSNRANGWACDTHGRIKIYGGQYKVVADDVYAQLSLKHPRIKALRVISKSSTQKFDYSIRSFIDGEMIEKKGSGSKLKVIAILYPELLEELSEIVNWLYGIPLNGHETIKRPEYIPLPESIDDYNK